MFKLLLSCAIVIATVVPVDASAVTTAKPAPLTFECDLSEVCCRGFQCCLTSIPWYYVVLFLLGCIPVFGCLVYVQSLDKNWRPKRDQPENDEDLTI